MASLFEFPCEPDQATANLILACRGLMAVGNGYCALSADDRTRMIEDSVAAGADVNFVTPVGNTPLSLLAMHDGLFFHAELLVNAGADICHQNNFGLTPLRIADTAENAGVSQYLRGILCMPPLPHAKTKDANHGVSRAQVPSF